MTFEDDEIFAIACTAAQKYIDAFEERTGTPYPFTQEGADACAFAAMARLAYFGSKRGLSVIMDDKTRTFDFVLS